MSVYAIIERETRAVRKGLRRAQTAALLPEQRRALMIAAICEAMRDRGAVTAADLARTGLPQDFITANFKPCLALAKDADPGLFRD